MTWWQFSIGIIIIWQIYLKTKRFFAHRNIMGKPVVIEYGDQNITFESIFPKSGIITGIIIISKIKFFVLGLDSPIAYKNQEFNKIAITERNTWSYLGAKDEVDVNVLLPKIELDKDKYTFDEFDHAVCAVINRIKPYTFH